jgi:hypothetical protein
MRESPLRQAKLRLVIISNIRLSNSAFHPARDHGKPIAQIISNNNRNLLLQPSAASTHPIAHRQWQYRCRNGPPSRGHIFW